MNERINQINSAINPLKEQIIHHKLYSVIKTIEDVKVFTQYHIFAVWDFMSLLKSLQQNLTCTTVPWFPKGTGEIRQLINEIVLGEESDVDLNGTIKSHFELYKDAMKQCGADTNQIETFLSVLKDTGSLHQALESSNTPQAARDFIHFTFKIINSNKDYLQAAIFTFGREDLIPAMFMSIVEDIHKQFPDSIAVFKYYLERHIEVDGDHHSHLALKMISNLCGNDDLKWKEVEQAAIESLKMRIALWDGVYNDLTKA